MHQLIQEFHVGFTGTQVGMTDEQKVNVSNILDSTVSANGDLNVWGHHGDCIGADAEFHEIAVSKYLRIAVHPPIDPKKRAHKEGTFHHPEKPYLRRNGELVACSDILIVAPKDVKEETRSGTWATFRLARKCGKSIIILIPDGKVVYI